MSASSRVRVYMGCSFDGFIAGPDDDISWLEESYTADGDLEPDPDAALDPAPARLFGVRERGTMDEQRAAHGRFVRGPGRALPVSGRLGHGWSRKPEALDGGRASARPERQLGRRCGRRRRLDERRAARPCRRNGGGRRVRRGVAPDAGALPEPRR